MPRSKKKLTLYHGTCPENARALIQYGWKPYSGITGAHGGQLRYLYLTNVPENAEWYAEERGCASIVVVSEIPIDALIVDPEDGYAETVEAELSLALPGSVALTKPLGPSHFSMYEGSLRGNPETKKLKNKLLR